MSQKNTTKTTSNTPPKNTNGTKAAIIIVVTIIILIILAIILQSVYRVPTSEFGTWSPIVTTTCLNGGQSCTIAGTATQYQVCTPNPTTGFGCLDNNGNQTFLNMSSTITCNPTCYAAIWGSFIDTVCQVYTDNTATTLAPNQTCVNNDPEEFSFTTTSRTCEPFDVTGTNACIKLDGSIAPIGYTESTAINCADIPPCYTGTWLPCTTNTITQNCGGTATECGEVIPSTEPQQCQALVGGVPTIVPSSNCNPLQQGPDCAINCFNSPCTTWPAGYSNITALQGMYVEFTNSITGKFLEASYTQTLINLIINPVATVNNTNVVTITTLLPHGFTSNQFVLIAGITGDINGKVNGIPITEINGYVFITNTTLNKFDITVTDLATSTGTGGGTGGTAAQGQLPAAQSNADVLNVWGDVSTIFASTLESDTIRFQLLPSQAHTADGVIYLVAYIPYNGQQGLAYWDSLSIKITAFPNLALGQTLDSLNLGNQFFFNLSQASAPYFLNNVSYPGPVYTSLFCGSVTPCIDYVLKTCPLYGPGCL